MKITSFVKIPSFFFLFIRSRINQIEERFESIDQAYEARIKFVPSSSFPFFSHLFLQESQGVELYTYIHIRFRTMGDDDNHNDDDVARVEVAIATDPQLWGWAVSEVETRGSQITTYL